MYYKTKFILSILIVSCIVACSSALYLPQKSHPEYAQLQMGRELYIQKCSSCHSLVLPEKYNAQDWDYWMNRMKTKSKLSETEEELILKYLKNDKYKGN